MELRCKGLVESEKDSILCVGLSSNDNSRLVASATNGVVMVCRGDAVSSVCVCVCVWLYVCGVWCVCMCAVNVILQVLECMCRCVYFCTQCMV